MENSSHHCSFACVNLHRYWTLVASVVVLIYFLCRVVIKNCYMKYRFSGGSVSTGTELNFLPPATVNKVE